MQLSPISTTTPLLVRLSQAGLVSLKKLSDSVKFWMLGKLQTSSPTVPNNLFPAALNTSRLVMLAMVSGRVLWILLSLTSNTVTLRSFPISGGRSPAILLLRNRTSTRSDMLPIVDGISPFNLLLARTSTVTGEAPKVSGMSPLKLLLLRNRASRRFSNS